MPTAPTSEEIFDELFAEKGLLARSLPGYESREGQQKMARQIWSALQGDELALFEAGTGIGKTFAYLIPSLLWSYKTGEKIVISTHTIALQEQLIGKDIPIVQQLLGTDLRVTLVKGMGNYLCLRKLDDLEKKQDFFGQSNELFAWARVTTKGTRSALPLADGQKIWKEVAAESESCSYTKCPHYKECFFFRARANVQTADIIIVNHALLLAHLKAEADRAILPEFYRLFVDEAHHLAPVALDALSERLDRVDLFRSMGRIHSDSSPETSRFFFLRDICEKIENRPLFHRLGLDLPAEKRDLLTKVHTAFDQLDLVMNQTRDPRTRLTPEHLESTLWKEEIQPAFSVLQTALSRYATSLGSLEKEMKGIDFPGVEVAIAEIASAAEKIEGFARGIEAFFEQPDPAVVRWTEKRETGTNLILSTLDVAPFLQSKLFCTMRSSVLCSATLTVGKDFSHVKKTLGLKQGIEEVHHSPFDFQERVRLFGFSDIAMPGGYDFVPDCCQVIEEAVRLSDGGAFVLFTSYDMLHKCADHLEPRLLDRGMCLFRQGDLPRTQLLEEFKQERRSVLFGADSFWEGVDVPGEALRLVIITKLPFPVPSDPLLQARAERIKQRGGDPFSEDSVPHAVMKFKQGFGRLMRRATDRGCVLCLDQRLFNRFYGKQFLQSLPECITTFAKRNQVFAEMQQFWS